MILDVEIVTCFLKGQDVNIRRILQQRHNAISKREIFICISGLFIKVITESSTHGMMNTSCAGIYQDILVTSGNVIIALNQDKVISTNGLDSVGCRGYGTAGVAIDSDGQDSRRLSAHGDGTRVQGTVVSTGCRAVCCVVDVGIDISTGNLHILSRLIATTSRIKDRSGHMGNQRERVSVWIDANYPFASRHLD